MRDLPPHLNTSILCAVFPETPTILDVDLSAFLMMVMSTTDSPFIPAVADVEYQPYIAEAWATFHVYRALKYKGKKHLYFNGVKIPPCKIPNLELH